MILHAIIIHKKAHVGGQVMKVAVIHNLELYAGDRVETAIVMNCVIPIMIAATMQLLLAVWVSLDKMIN